MAGRKPRIGALCGPHPDALAASGPKESVSHFQRQWDAAARALVVELVRRYSVLGFDCSNLEIQKLAWLLQRAIVSMGLPDPLDLRFAANKYGPYDDRLRHLLDGLDGTYLHCGKRLADAGPFDSIWFEPSRRMEIEGYLSSGEASRYVPALELTTCSLLGLALDRLASPGSPDPCPGRLSGG